jgi:hypothetical protein
MIVKEKHKLRSFYIHRIFQPPPTYFCLFQISPSAKYFRNQTRNGRARWHSLFSSGAPPSPTMLSLILMIFSVLRFLIIMVPTNVESGNYHCNQLLCNEVYWFSVELSAVVRRPVHFEAGLIYLVTSYLVLKIIVFTSKTQYLLFQNLISHIVVTNNNYHIHNWVTLTSAFRSRHGLIVITWTDNVLRQIGVPWW